MPVKNPKKPVTLAPESGYNPKPEKQDSENHLLSVLIVIVVALGILLGFIADDRNDIQEELAVYKEKEAYQRDLEEFEYACKNLKDYNSSFKFYYLECYNDSVSLKSKKEVENAIFHYQLGNKK